MFFIFEKENNLKSVTVTLGLYITTSRLIGVTVADVTWKRNVFVKVSVPVLIYVHFVLAAIGTLTIRHKKVLCACWKCQC